eukprot:s536_g27.t1
MLPKLGSRSSFPLFPSIFGPPPAHVLDPLEVGKASGCGGGRFQTEETSIPEGGDISVADINDDDIDFDEEISFLPDSQSQRGLDFETVLVQVNSQEKKPTIEDDGCAGRLVQAVDEAISRSRSAVAACASNQNSFEDTAAVALRFTGLAYFLSKGDTAADKEELSPDDDDARAIEVVDGIFNNMVEEDIEADNTAEAAKAAEAMTNAQCLWTYHSRSIASSWL